MGGLTAIDGLGAERIRGYKQTTGRGMQTHSGNAQTAVSKGGETDRLKTYSSRMTAIESKGSRSERLRD